MPYMHYSAGIEKINAGIVTRLSPTEHAPSAYIYIVKYESAHGRVSDVTLMMSSMTCGVLDRGRDKQF
jgi:hypothetical protein